MTPHRHDWKLVTQVILDLAKLTISIDRHKVEAENVLVPAYSIRGLQILICPHH